MFAPILASQTIKRNELLKAYDAVIRGLKKHRTTHYTGLVREIFCTNCLVQTLHG